MRDDWTSLPADGIDYTVGLEDGVRGLRIAYSPTLGYAKNVHPEIAAAVHDAVRVLESLGAHVEMRDPGFEDPLEITTGLWFLGAATIWQGLTPAQQALTDPDLRAQAEEGARLSALQVQQLHLRRGQLGSQMRQFMQDVEPPGDALGGHSSFRGACGRHGAHEPAEHAGLDALQLPVQPHPAAGDHAAVRIDPRRTAHGGATGGPDVWRRPGAACRSSL